MTVAEKRAQREEIVKLLYLTSMGGDYDKTGYEPSVIEITTDVIAVVGEIDAIISANLQNWTIDRLNYVDKAILRYAVYEMKYAALPAEIAINEALELTKKYTNLDDDNAKSFNNRLLENIKNNLF